ncbi:Cleavage/polyadenylation specificity factor, A subunit, N-terminal [Dillenia turbinata]|uniref:Cleavage/polyadenylation specificity factor, A subunit, N-terminal n=1 Tax=Dillenia turbinata TaxID=194707 RepID=A0AAN8ZPK3_9MAGN
MAIVTEESSSAKSRSRSSNDRYYLAKCVLRGSVILQVVHGHLRSPSSSDVVFGKILIWCYRMGLFSEEPPKCLFRLRGAVRRLEKSFVSTYDIVETSIELVAICEDGIVQSVCEQAVFGTIKDLAVLRWNEKSNAQTLQTMGKDMLVIISDSGKLSFLAFCNEMHRFYSVTHVQLSNPGNSLYQVGRKLAVDSTGCFVAAGAYEDRLTLFSISMSGGSDIIVKRVNYPPEEDGVCTMAGGFQRTSICGTIWSMCFISTDFSRLSVECDCILAILLNRQGEALNKLLLLGWKTSEQSVHVISQHAEAGPLAHDICEVPHYHGFAFLFRAGDILLMDLRDVHSPYCVYRTSLIFLPAVFEEHNFLEDSLRVHDCDDEGIFDVAASALLELRDSRMDILKNDDPMSIDNDGNGKSTSKYVCSWSWEPGNEDNRRMIFCLDTGEFYLISISFDSDGLKVNLSDCLYKGQPCKALLWVGNGFVAAIAEMGDGMVLKLEEGALLYSSPIQNIAPILDMSVVDYHDEKQDQVFACCGMAPEGSLRIIRNGVSVEKLLRTASIYPGITNTWAVRMKVFDIHHSFLVLSFVEETRVLSVGLSFTDVTDSIGFLPDVCTLACGLISDGLLVQIHQDGIRLCLPTTVAHPDGIGLSAPICTSWCPDNLSISLGAVGQNLIVVATSNPCFLFILGVRSLAACKFEVYEIQHLNLPNELSCISIPSKHPGNYGSTSVGGLEDKNFPVTSPAGIEIGSSFVIGTHKPSVEVLSFVAGKGYQVVATGAISLTNAMGTAITGCIPQDVRLVLVDRLYVLSGLRNGMLLRFEWPSASTTPCSSKLPSQRAFLTTSLLNGERPLSNFTISIGSQTCAGNSYKILEENIPVSLQLIAIRRIGITPVFLVPLTDALDADIIVLSDRPWLLQTARHSLSYTSISFQPSTHVTPICSVECPKGILFVAENTLNLIVLARDLPLLLLPMLVFRNLILINGGGNLSAPLLGFALDMGFVEMVHSKRLNVQKFHLGGTPRKVLYHSESRLLLVLRTDVDNDTCSSDICCVDPLNGSVLSSYKLELGETGKSMDLVRVGNDQVLVVGTSKSAGPAIMPSGEAESTMGRLVVLCLEHVQNSDNGSMTFCSKAGSSSQRTSPFCEIVGYAADQLSGSSLCSSPDDNSCDGIKLEDTEAWQLRLAYSVTMPGVVLAVCPYLDRYFLVSAGNAFYVCVFPNDNPQRVKKLAVGRTRFMIVSLTAHFTRIAVGDCRDGILFYAYHEDARKLEQLYCDPVQRLVADCILLDVDTAVVSDRKGSIAVLSCSNHLEGSSPVRGSNLISSGISCANPTSRYLSIDSASPECNLMLGCSYYIGEVAIRIKKGSFSYRLPADDVLKSCDDASSAIDFSHGSIMASTLLGSIIIFIPLTREEHEILEAVQARLVVHPLTAPVLGNDHNEFRSREISAGVLKILDGDMLAQFLELTSLQQEAVLAFPISNLNSFKFSKSDTPHITVNQVVQVLERVHSALH